MKKYEFNPKMGEISGFGGGYEKSCRKMITAGLKWFDKNPKAKPKYTCFKNVYGIMIPDNDHAKFLDQVVLESSSGITGAMHQAVINSILWIRKNGWTKYVKEMSKRGGEIAVSHKEICQLGGKK